MIPERVKQVAIIGGGAAGLATAIFAAEQLNPRYYRVVIFDGAGSLGAKILVAGGGRCNVTNENVSEEDYFGNPNIVRGVLKRFTQLDAMKWFNSMEVRLKTEDTGKLFPESDRADTVLGALIGRAYELKIKIATHDRVNRIEARDDMFTIMHERGKTLADVVVLAMGGKSLPKTGSDGAGYRMAKQLGHSVTDTYASLVPLVLEEGYMHEELSGVTHDVEISVFADKKCIDKRRGSMLWTHFGVSGPVVMDASRCWVKASEEGLETTVKLNFLPDETFDSLEKRLLEAITTSPRKAIGTWLSIPLPRSLVSGLIESLDLEPAMQLHELTRECRRDLLHALLELELPVVEHRGWNYAEVTAGGVPLDEIDRNTMMSREHDGLFLVGEILDCDGRIGGFNFQWAWSTGYIAGQSIAAYIKKELKTDANEEANAP